MAQTDPCKCEISLGFSGFFTLVRDSLGAYITMMKKTYGIRRMGMGVLASVVCAGLSAGSLSPSVALGCGGCFAPPSTVQVVTDHRMVLAVSPAQTTLWDQFRYSGRPSEFSWILPIRYSPAVHIGIADDRFMQSADNLTSPLVTRPVSRCGFASAGGAADASFPPPPPPPSSARDSGVTVHREEVVGPYDVAIIGGTDPMAVRVWLMEHGYTVPPGVSPVIDYYTELRMDFIALRLRPGEGIDRMSPVRVTVPGNMPTLPLRMIAAGVADKVGLSLVVLASTRMEAMNFPNGVVLPSDLTWDFRAPTNPAIDFLNAFERRNRAAGGRLWLTESSNSMAQATFMAYAESLGMGAARDAGSSADAGVSDIRDDIRTAYTGLGDRAVVTRMRADLAAGALDRDLTLTLSDMGSQSRNYSYGTALNDPCGTGPTTPVDAGPVFPPNLDGGRVTGSRDSGALTDAPATPSLTSGGIRCATHTPGSTSTGFFGLLSALGAVALRRRRS